MKKIVMIALCIAAAWSCSDDKGTNNNDDGKGIVDERFEKINGIIRTSAIGEKLDTIGTYSIDDALCSTGEDYIISAYPNLCIVATEIHYEINTVQEVVITLETCLMSQSLIDDLETKGYGMYENHKTYSKETVFMAKLPVSSFRHQLIILDKPAGAYLVKILRKDDSTSCIPIIVAK